jgi:hypothetical protein
MSLQDQMQQQIDEIFCSLNNPWTSPMVFNFHVGPDCATEASTYPIDICQFLRGDILPTEFKGIQRSIKREMTQAVNHNSGQQWVSTNAGRAESHKRFKGAQLGLTQFN